MDRERIENLLSLTLAEGAESPPMVVDEETRNRIEEGAVPAEPEVAVKGRYVPVDPGRPWRDFIVQNCARRFLKEVVLPDWVENHPHPNCSNVRVDEWGRLLCRLITPTQIGVDGPWENPTHFLFYAYNSFQTQQYYGTRLNTFLESFCNVDLSGYA
jgi:hypothetical protein